MWNLKNFQNLVKSNYNKLDFSNCGLDGFLSYLRYGRAAISAVNELLSFLSIGQCLKKISFLKNSKQNKFIKCCANFVKLLEFSIKITIKIIVFKLGYRRCERRNKSRFRKLEHSPNIFANITGSKIYKIKYILTFLKFPNFHFFCIFLHIFQKLKCYENL